MKKLLYILLFVPLALFGQTSFEDLIENTSLNEGLIQCYPFSGSANDISGNNLHGEAINVDLITDRFGSTNSAYNFDYSHTTFGGQGDEVFIPYDPIMNVNHLTVSVWLKPFEYTWSGNSGNSIIINRYQFGYSTPVGEHWGLSYGSDNIIAFIRTNIYGEGVNTNYNYSLPLNEWHHIVATYNQEKLILYLNGILVAEESYNGVLNQDGLSGVSIGESNQANGCWHQTNGIIDDVGVWNRALTSEEIELLYIGVISGCTDSLALNYNPNANQDDGTCIDVVYGCTDTLAVNYSDTATVDDGSCIYSEYLAIDLLPNDTTICEGDMLNISVLSEVNTDYLVNNGWSQIYSIGQSTYWLLDQDVTWEEANEFAQQAGGYLYSPNTQEEHLNLYNQLANTGNDGISYWIGMYQDINASNYTEPNGGWILSDGSVPNYYNWAISEPSNGGGDEHVVQFEWEGIGAQWNDAEGFDSDGNCVCYIARPIIEMNNQFNNIIWSTGDTVSEISLPIFENQNIIIEIQDNDIVYTDTIYITLLTQEVCYLFENSNPILAVQQALLTIDTLLNQGVITISSLQQALDTWNTTIDLDAGWNMFGYGCPNPIDVAEGLSNHTESIAIVKDNNGAVYLPEWDFNGIGDFTPGFGYQIKVTEAIEGFSLCDWYVNDIPEDNIVSLQEENASLQAELDSIESFIQNGDEAHGGIVFHVDSSGLHGLVAYYEDFALEWEEGIEFCDNFESNSYNDWYLSSISELVLMHLSIGIGTSYENLSNISSSRYWSSSSSNPWAWHYKHPLGGYQAGPLDGSSLNNNYLVRPIRSF